MARNRKRRSERRPRRPAGGPSAQPGLATASAGRRDENADPLQHAAPDVELAEAQLALGRPELAGEAVDEDELDEEALQDGGGAGGDIGDDDRVDGSGGGDGSRPRRGGGGELAPAPRAGAPTRLVHFLQGSWRELQRVQWPDRRQVMQATSVVIGFVIVAGVFLGVADFVATKVVNLILK